MPSHTPGPWIEGVMGHDMDMDGVANGEWVPIGVSDEDGFAGCVALAHPANARLIAAAPKMLEALKAALKTLEVASFGDKSLYSAPVTVAARAILREVEGESNE